MIFLLLSILCSTILIFVFKGFDHYGVDNLQAIVCNYYVCLACASLTLGAFPIQASFWEEPWFPYAFGLGFIFISGFLATAMTIQKFGVTIGAIMQKMSIVLSVAAAIYLYQESTNALKIMGIVMALIAIVLTNIPHKDNPIFKDEIPLQLWFLPFYTWLSMGIIEVVLQYVELRVADQSGDLNFTGFLFGTAGTLGLIIVLVQYVRNKAQFAWKNIVAGIALGVPNFGSIYFLMRSLGIGWEGSVVFPINNVSIIVLSTFLAILFLKEKLSKLNLLGVGFAILSIVLIALA